MEKSIAFTFGRFNPPSIGHALTISTVNRVSIENNCEARVFMSTSCKNRDKDPLPVGLKYYWIDMMFRTLMGDSVSFDFAKDAFEVLDELNKNGYTDLKIIVGSDRVSEFERLLNNFKRKFPNNGFKNVKIYCAGVRDPDSDDLVSSISSTKMREYAKNNDYESFRETLPKTLSEADKIRFFRDVQFGLGVNDAILLESKFR